jgi:formylmethanofuran dehydrogenase subunit C
MSVWTLSLRRPVEDPVDASKIRLQTFRDRPAREIGAIPIVVASQTMPLGDLFSFERTSDEGDGLVIQGDLSRFDRLGDRHDSGRIRVVGSVGDHAGSCMSGGTLIIEGDAGDHVAAPHDASRQGMRGGRITVGGSVGNYAGHRMRRGEIFVAGDAGRFAASQMVAGTLVVAGRVDRDAGTGMRRGTLIVSDPLSLPDERFTAPVVIRSVFPTLLRRTMTPEGPAMSRIATLVGRMAAGGFLSRRGDRAVAGQGEILTPASE